MSEAQEYLKGDYFIDFSEVYVITDIRGKGGDRTVHYAPAFPGEAEESLTYSEPYESFVESNKRRPIDISRAKAILELLKEPPEEEDSFNINSYEAAVKHSNVDGLVSAIRVIKDERVDPDSDVSYTKKRSFRQVMDYLSKELAVAMNIKPETAEKRIQDRLKKAH